MAATHGGKGSARRPTNDANWNIGYDLLNGKHSSEIQYRYVNGKVVVITTPTLNGDGGGGDHEE